MIRGSAKGQASVEVILILAVTLLILSSIIFLAYSNLQDMKTEIAIRQARQAVNAICMQSDKMYSLGDGTKLTVEVIFPEGFVAEKSYVSKNTVNIFVAGSNIDCKSTSIFSGQLPNSSGRHIITLYKEEGVINVS